MAQQTSVVISIVAAGAITGARGVTAAGLQATDGVSSAGQAVIGFSYATAASGEALAVVVGGTVEAESGAAIDGVETRLKTDASGRFIPWTTNGDIVAARLAPVARNTASAAGQFVQVIPVLS
jgi:hypothetical protein